MRIHLYSLHGLFRGKDLEIGRDSDNGGQIIYVMELAQALSQLPEIECVHLFTRRIDDQNYSSDYNVPVEKINDKFDIRRIYCGGKKYLPKEWIWDHLDEFVSNTIQHIKTENIFPDWMHSHYADAGYVVTELSAYLNVPYAHTAHSLGKPKLEKLLASGLERGEAFERYHFNDRFNAEEAALANAEFIVTSTDQEISVFKDYINFNLSEYHILPPGIDFEKYYPYFEDFFGNSKKSVEQKQAMMTSKERMDLFFTEPTKPIILAICRPDRKKNIHGLLHAYGADPELQAVANLAIFAGIRSDISEMPQGEKEVLTELLLSMDRYNLYGKLAIPKRHDTDSEVPEIYRLCARQKGVFINVALTEHFGLTILEAASCGCPIVATNHGGPSEILPTLENGILVGPDDTAGIQAALKKILINSDLWTQYSNSGVQKIRDHYSWPAHVKRYMELVSSNREASEGIGMKNISKMPLVQRRLKISNKMLITDIDGTLVDEGGDQTGIEELREILKNRGENFIFGIASGRSLVKIRKALEDYDIPIPDIVISSVGANIYYGLDKNLADKGWRQHIAYRWKRTKAIEIIKGFPGLTLQEEANQSSSKISYYVEEDIFDYDKLMQLLGPMTRQLNVILTRGIYLDILPKRASKGRAVRYLAHKWSVPLHQTLVCGDSGNDLDMFAGSTMGVVVGDHAEEMEILRNSKWVHFSSESGPRGVLDGIKQFNFFEK